MAQTVVCHCSLAPPALCPTPARLERNDSFHLSCHSSHMKRQGAAPRCIALRTFPAALARLSSLHPFPISCSQCSPPHFPALPSSYSLYLVAVSRLFLLPWPHCASLPPTRAAACPHTAPCPAAPLRQCPSSVHFDDFAVCHIARHPLASRTATAAGRQTHSCEPVQSQRVHFASMLTSLRTLYGTGSQTGLRGAEG